MGVDVGTEDIENLIGEYGGQEGVDEDTGMITEINFDEFVNMVAALPPTYEVPSIAKRCRDYADEVAERRGNRARRSRLHRLLSRPFSTRFG